MAAGHPSWRRVYPFASHWLDVGGGVRMHYVDEGAGAPLLCVHGNPTWSFYYRGVIAAFRETQRVVAPDHVGCGLSDKPGDDRYDYVLERRVHDLELLIERLNLREITLVVHDWGGMIGIAAALRNLHRFSRFVILNTAAFRLPAGLRLPWRLWVVRNTPLGPLLVRGFNAFARGATRMAVVRPMPSEIAAGLVAPYDSWANRIATLRFVQDIPLRPGDRSYDLVKWVDEHVGELAARPMWIGWGLRDFVFDAGFLTEWRRRFPQAEVHEFPDAGHYVLEDAGTEIEARMRAFLREPAVVGA